MNKEKGQSLVELAISLVILMFLLGGIVEFGMMFFQFVQLRDASQEGVIFGSANANNFLAIENRVRGSSNSPINLSDTSKVIVRLSVIGKDGNPKNSSLACEGDNLKVELFFNHHIFMPFFPKLIGRDDITLHAESTGTILTPRCP